MTRLQKLSTVATDPKRSVGERKAAEHLIARIESKHAHRAWVRARFTITHPYQPAVDLSL